MSSIFLQLLGGPPHYSLSHTLHSWGGCLGLHLHVLLQWLLNAGIGALSGVWVGMMMRCRIDHYSVA